MMLPAATALAARLDGINRERRQIEARMQADALAALRGMDDPESRAAQRHGLCLFDESWHQGVVGLVASRIKDRTGRPVIAFARAADAMLRGSARSVPGLHIRDVLDAIATRKPALIARFGGHAMAAGMTLAAGHLDEFAAEFDAEVGRWAQRGRVFQQYRDRRRAVRGGAGVGDRRPRCAPGAPGGRRFPNPPSMASSPCATPASSANGT